jgi:hypothetical protein
LTKKWGYNVLLFGFNRSGIKLSPEQCKAISKRNKGQKRSKETCDKISKIHKGKIVSKETRKKESDSQKKLYKNGYINPMRGKHHSLETINILSKPKSEEHKNKLSKTRIERGLSKGQNNPMFGKHHSDESKLKNRLSHLGKKHTLERNQRQSERIRGKNHPLFDHAIYAFKNTLTNEIYIGTRYDFYKKINSTSGQISLLINKKKKSVKNWILIPNIIDYQI